MGIKRHKHQEIVTKLRQVEVPVRQGVARIDAIGEVQITKQTFYRWPKCYGGMGTVQLKELKRLQKENERLRRARSYLTPDQSMGAAQFPKVRNISCFSHYPFFTHCQSIIGQD